MLSGLVRETFTNQRELRYTAQLGPEMEERELLRGLVSVLESC